METELHSAHKHKKTHLPTEVHDVGVWVVEGQEHSVAGVHLIYSHGLLHIILRKV